MYKSLDLAKYIVAKCADDKQAINNLQLQSILYCTQKEFFKRGKQAFADRFEAWGFGACIPNVYYYFCGSGSMPIFHVFDTIELDLTDQLIVDDVVDMWKTVKPWEIVQQIHKPGGAWDRTWNGGKGLNSPIPNIAILKED